VASLLAWGGQAISWLAPERAQRLGLAENEDAVEPVFWADIRGEARWDALTLWTLMAGAILLILDRPAWAYFGLAGGAIYAYFAGRGISARLAMQRRGFRIGTPENIRIGYAFLVVWGVMALITIAMAITDLR
jgi:hypothetical protein